MWFLSIVLILTLFIAYTYKLVFFIVIGLYIAIVFYLALFLFRLSDEEKKD